jgi:hypothetical protein
MEDTDMLPFQPAKTKEQRQADSQADRARIAEFERQEREARRQRTHAVLSKLEELGIDVDHLIELIEDRQSGDSF